MNIVKKQYLITLYVDGKLRITERHFPKHDEHGRFVSANPNPRRRILGTGTCPNCGAKLMIVK